MTPTNNGHLIPLLVAITLIGLVVWGLRFGGWCEHDANQISRDRGIQTHQG